MARLHDPIAFFDAKTVLGIINYQEHKKGNDNFLKDIMKKREKNKKTTTKRKTTRRKRK